VVVVVPEADINPLKSGSFQGFGGALYPALRHSLQLCCCLPCRPGALLRTKPTPLQSCRATASALLLVIEPQRCYI
jgi:hypothetical protein